MARREGALQTGVGRRVGQLDGDGCSEDVAPGEGVSLGGFGVPTLVFSQNERIFGPVLINPPTGEKADKLWHLITGWLEFPNLYEMQRPKMPSDLEMISDAFNPYVKARDWETRANPTP